jgi:hypothetical protein
MIPPCHPLGAYPPYEVFIGHQRRVHLPSASSSLQISIVYFDAYCDGIVVRGGNRYESYSCFLLL